MSHARTNQQYNAHYMCKCHKHTDDVTRTHIQAVCAAEIQKSRSRLTMLRVYRATRST